MLRAALFAALGGCCTVWSQGPSITYEAWQHGEGRSARHGSWTPFAGPAGAASVIWALHGSGTPATSSVASFGTVSTLLAWGTPEGVRAAHVTGTTAWQVATLGDVAGGVAFSVDGDFVYAGSRGGRLYAIGDLGFVWWVFAVDGAITGAPTPSDARGGPIVVGTHAGTVFSVSARGTRLWAAHVGGAVLSSAALSPTGGLVFVVSADGACTALAADTGAFAWAVQVSASVDPASVATLSSPAVTEDARYVLVGSYDGNVLCLDATTGAVRWNESTATVGAAIARVVATPSLDATTVFVGTCDDPVTGAVVQGGTVSTNTPEGGTVLALRIADGTLAWRTPVRGCVRAAASVSGDGFLYVGAGDGAVRALRTDTGAVVWTVQLNTTVPEPVTTTPCIGAGGALNVGGARGTIAHLNAISHSPSTAPSPLPPPSNAPPTMSLVALAATLSTLAAIAMIAGAAYYAHSTCRARSGASPIYTSLSDG